MNRRNFRHVRRKLLLFYNRHVRRFLSSPNGHNQSELHRFQYSFRLPQMASHANGSHRKPKYFPESDGKHFGWPHVEVMCTILRRLHHLFEDPRNTFHDSVKSFNAFTMLTWKSILQNAPFFKQKCSFWATLSVKTASKLTPKKLMS